MSESNTKRMATWALVGGLLLLAGCATAPVAPQPPRDLMAIPDAVPRAEPFSRSGNPEFYDQSGVRYWVLSSPFGYRARGVASWYGAKFHGRRTSSGESYDMYAMTAAHKTLPIPCYARVTNLENGRSVVVKINDRGPFIEGRIVDLSYAAAHKLGMAEQGIAQVELQVIDTRGDFDTRYAAAGEAATSPLAAPGVGGDTAPVYGEVIPARPLNAPQAVTVANPEPSAKAEVLPVVAKTPMPAAVTAAPPGSGIPPGVYLQMGAFSSAANAGQEQQKLLKQQSGPVKVEIVRDSLGTLYRVMVGPLSTHEVATAVGQRLTSLGWDQFRIVNR